MSEGQDGPQGAMTGGSLAVRMMSLRAMAASQMKRAANDKTLAQTLASHKSGPPAARLGDKIQHKSFLGALAGAVVGAIVTIAEGGLIAAACLTGPYALVLVPALIYGSYKADDYVEEKQDQLESWINSFCDPDGAINTGSKNVRINGKPAARAAVTLPPPPPPEAIPSPSQGEPSWGDIAGGVLDSAMEKAAPLGNAFSTALNTLTDSNASFMDRAAAGASLLLPCGPVIMEFTEMVGGRGGIKKDVDFPEAGEDTAICDKENKPPKIAQGSSNVFINNQPAARQGDKLECSAAIVEGSPNVFIGGEQVTYLDIQPEFPPWQRAILGGITIASYLLPPASLVGKLGTFLGKAGKLLGPKLGALLARTGKIKGAFGKFIKWLKDPVDPVTGAFCDERTDFTLGQTLPLSFTRFYSSALPLHGLTGAGWSDSWSDYAWVRERGSRVDIAIQGDTLSFAFEGDGETAVNPYHAQFILRRRDDYLELFDRDTLSSRFFYDAFPGMRLRHPLTDGTANPRLAHTAGDRMYVLGGMSDTANNRITFERDGQYRLVGVSHTDGIRLRLTYHDSGYLKAIQRTDNGVETLAEYRQDAQGRLTEADARLDYHLFYDYDDAGRIVRWSDNDQTWCEFAYDDQGRVVSTGGAEGYYRATLAYLDGYTAVTDSKGTSYYRYDVNGNILQEVAADGSVTTYQWDEYHHLLAKQSPAGRLERFTYDTSHGQLTRYTAADGAVWRYGYDERGLLASVTDPAGQTWTQQCDERGLPVSLVSPQGEETRLEYTPHGLLSGIFRRDERRLSVRYDRHNRPETLTDATGREHHTEYSGHDLPVRMRGPGGQDARLQWQAHHKLSGLQRSGTGAEGFEYDRHGNLLAYTDGNGIQWRMAYGPFDLPVARTDGEGNRWQYRYDKDALQLTEVINPQGESYRYILDNMGRVAEERDWGGVTWRYGYDADGLCIARTNGLEEITRYGWDAAGRLAEVSTAEGKTQYAYDKTGRLTGIFSADGTEQRTAYDERGRVTVVTQGRRATEYHYPDERTVTRCILLPEEERDKHPDEALLKTTYRYNAAGELEHITLPGGETLTFTRDEAGREIRREGSGGFVQAQEWNSANRLMSQRAGYSPASSSPGTPASLYTALSRDYRYDNAGNLTDVTERGETGSETRREYRTDRNGQITTVTVTGSGRGAGEGNEYYRYDSCGYLENQAAGHYRTGGDGLYRRGHRLKRSGNREYDYDAAGRMVSRTTQRDGYRPEREQFRWDSRDQLTGYSNGKGEQWTYRYDGSGRRTEKRCDSQGIRITYLWDGDSIAEIREYRHDVLSSVRHLVFSGFELVSQQVSRERQAHPTEPVRWVTRTVHAVSEPTGRPLMFFNSAGKAVKRPAAVTLWGQRVATSTADYDQPYRREDEEADPGLLYAGQWLDAESGLCYNRFRYYEPESGMYLVSDPLGLAGGVNTYAYVPNPLEWIDPLGLAVCPKKIKALLEGEHGTVVYVKSKKEADALLKAAFPDFQKVKGIGHQKITGGNVEARVKNKMRRFEKEGRAYHKDYAVGKDGRPVSHAPGKEWHEYPHIDINRGSNGVKDIVHIAIKV
ncbi:RHS repeat-associated core domain protein [Salmonella enterica subsp. enterica serovar Infantis str. SARB27]|uniref:Type IV secretion protein Rhs n=2 Tax=Salmonella infantis TaxID=595 RepID=A0A5Y7AMA8_SALIN|nr:RHS repeat-associated core domain-containing protein [Salmonella enterica]ECK9504174.1 type IV secretion protein Rhs [Salmonella enterica subsp. enterica serovar Infantis str. CFSAN000522]EHB41265.1 RHS repeat-associated core domain protein [Salmonella enterica subsp. enterica serovar Infantis str. SARB27]QCV24260.1 type IV secretion protein Rhs [Salmonella enterica subsp. enterica serovar Infantis]QCV28739.1 type IV secretion protein Rhs [Salmonella enterica subsp. enterica serovar Infantis